MSAEESSGITGFGPAVIQTTCWNPQHGPSTEAETPCLVEGASSDAPLVCRVSNSAKYCYKVVSLQLEKKKGLTALELFNDVNVWMEIKIGCQLPSKQLVFLPCWMLKECQRRFFHESCVNVENVSSSAARRCNEAGWLPQPFFCTANQLLSGQDLLLQEVSKVCVGFVAR